MALRHPIPPGQECSKGKWPLVGARGFSVLSLKNLPDFVALTGILSNIFGKIFRFLLLILWFRATKCGRFAISRSASAL